MQVSTEAMVITGIEKEDRLHLSGFASEAYEILRINRLLYRLEKTNRNVTFLLNVFCSLVISFRVIY